MMSALVPVLDLSAANDFTSEVEAASGANVLACLQCRKCTSGCPVAGRSDFRPHEMVLMVLLGQKEPLLRSRMIWECTSCHTCATRCPQKVDIAAMVDALRQISRQERMVTGQTTSPVFNDIFLRLVRRFGRMYEMGLMASYKLRTLKLMDDAGKFPMMLLKRKLSLLPSFVRGHGDRKRLFRKTTTKAEI
jgi:heterodisulfide reductase subunit C2